MNAGNADAIDSADPATVFEVQPAGLGAAAGADPHMAEGVLRGQGEQ